MKMNQIRPRPVLADKYKVANAFLKGELKRDVKDLFSLIPDFNLTIGKDGRLYMFWYSQDLQGLVQNDFSIQECVTVDKCLSLHDYREDAEAIVKALRDLADKCERHIERHYTHELP